MNDLKTMTTAELLAELDRLLTVSEDSLKRLGHVIVELENRGMSLADRFPRSFLETMRKIGTGQMLPGLALRFLERPKTLRQLGCLDLKEQQAILDDPQRQQELEAPKPRQSAPQRQTTGLRGKAVTDEELGQVPGRKTMMGAAAQATVKDLAEMIVEMITNHPQPCDVWQAIESSREIRTLTKPARKRAS